MPKKRNPVVSKTPAKRVRAGTKSKSSNSKLVNKPDHYAKREPDVECIDIVENMNFCSGNALKYAFRAGHKVDADMKTDLQKSIWYLKRAEKLGVGPAFTYGNVFKIRDAWLYDVATSITSARFDDAIKLVQKELRKC